MYAAIVFLVITFEQTTNAQELTVITGPIFNIQFSPNVLELIENNEVLIQMNTTAVNGTNAAYNIQVTSDDTDVVQVVTDQKNPVIPQLEALASNTSNFTVRGEWIGRAALSFNFENTDTGRNDQINSDAYDVTVVRPDRIEDDIFEYSLGLIIMVNNVGFGCKFDWKIAKYVFSRPLAVIIGVCGQYVVLPLVSKWIFFFFFYKFALSLFN